MNPAQEKKSVTKRPVLIGGITLGVLLLAGIVILIVWLVSLGSVSTDDASIEGAHASVSSKTMGRIQTMPKDEGMRVSEGDILATLDDTDLRAQEAQLLAALNNTKLNLSLADVNLKRTKNDFDRITPVYKSGNSTPEQYDHAAKALDAAKVQYSIAEAQIATAKAQLGITETQLSNTKILSPIMGIIAKRNYSVGEIVQPGQPIFVINDLDNVWIVANFEETRISLIKPGAKVDVTVDAYPNYQFKGKVSQVSAGIVPPPFSIGETTKTTQKIPVRIEFTKIPQGATLRPGMSVEVSISVN
jgi:RND family efflux transporter MFP subunit